MSHFSLLISCSPICSVHVFQNGATFHHFTALCYTYAIHSTDRVGIRPSLSVKVGGTFTTGILCLIKVRIGYRRPETTVLGFWCEVLFY